MRPTPPSFAEAITAASRHMHSRVRLWPNGFQGEPLDVSGLVESVKTSRELGGQLPEEVRLVEGAGTVKADLTVTGATGLSAAATWARDTPVGPLAGRERLAVPITVDIGVTVSGDGPRFARVFTGGVRAVALDGATSATVTALDARDTARDPLTFPPVADDFAGLSLHWCIAYAAHAVGFDAQPSPMRAHGVDVARGYWPLVYWPMSGSHAPFVSGPNAHTATVATWQQPDRDAALDTGGFVSVPAPWNGPAAFAGYFGRRRWRRITGTASTFLPADAPTRPPATGVRFEAWVKSEPGTTTAPGGDAFRLGLTDGPSLRLTATGAAVLDVPRADGRRRMRFAAPPLNLFGWRAGEWNHFGAHVSTTPKGHTAVTWRFNGREIRLSYPGIRAALGTCDNAELDSWLNLSNVAISRCPSSAGWLDGHHWAATALITGADTPMRWPGEFAAAPTWDHLTAIADATGSATYFDPHGRLVFTGPPAAVRLPVAEVTTRDRITALSVEDSLDRVRNHVTVTEHGGVVKPPGKEPLWTFDGPRAVDPGEVAEFDVEFAEPCLAADSRVSVTAAPARGESWVYVDYAKTPQGSGRPVPGRYVVAALVDVSGTRATLTVRNKAKRRVWVTKPPSPDTGTASATGASSDVAAAGIAGHSVKASTKKYVEKDEASIAQYGAFAFDDPDAPWRQSGSAERARRLLADLSRPRATVTGVSIVGDPRLDLGDVITIRDPDGTRLDGAYAITAIADDHTPSSGYTQALTVHPAPLPTIKETHAER
ncbi:hypothetical protein [Stackebrandtia nassauensis]|uniref:Uncharacterized protein n=1 Tax=Stackebrandtia nassauensis (strain DSM 44728 / CIP 108903 / NRRL B-16338 / NBRC 102104 / LLR-40K-21) TaxID=446470 RepID=D3Q2F3_STANL|nr:hypothetical protein [Stackebrandtia nassauensis]ADD43886.1 hypothetical protein Snas_4237 [Stackebrandtia nassauensis DSM 44728]